MAEKDYLPKHKEEEFISFLNEQVTNHPVVKNYHGKWKELIAWADLGDQFSEWIPENKRVSSIVPKLRKRHKTVVINLMKPLGEALEGKINMYYQLAGSPNSSEIEDAEAAKISTKLLGHNDYVNSIENLCEDFKYDLTRTGNAWFKWIWDTNGHGFMQKKEDDGKVENVKQEGEVRGFVPSVFNIRPDPTAKKREDMRWLIEIQEVAEDEIIRKFKLTKEEFSMKLGKESGTQKYAGMHELMEDKDPKEKTHIVKFYWERESEEFPEGRYIIAVGNLILYKGANPAFGEIPFFHVGFKRHANSMWYTGPFHHVQPIQREFNRMVSIISEHLEGWRAKMIVPRGSILKEGSFTTDSFELLEVDTTKGEPRPANMPELSPQITAWRDFLIGAVDKVSNVHEVSYSQLPQYASRAPASLYSMMLEQENLKIDPLIKRMNKVILDMGKFRLRLMDKYYKYPRLVKVIGKGQESSIEYYKGSDIKGNFDVKVIIGISLNQPKVIQQRLLLELKQLGAPIDWNRIFKLLGDGDISEELRGDIADESRAIRENQAFVNDTYDRPREKGGVFVYIHDNHDLHLDYHSNLSKTEEAQKWPPKKWDALQNHIAEHLMYQQMAQMAKMTPGATAGAGVPGVAPEAGMPPGVAAAGAETMAEGAGVAPEVAMTREFLT